MNNPEERALRLRHLPPHNTAEHHGVWVFVEQIEGLPNKVSWELLGEGRKLADRRGCQLAAAVLGQNVDHIVAESFAYGADLVYAIDSPLLSQYRTYPYRIGLTALVRKHKPEILLIGATYQGRDLAGAVATDLLTGLTADCTMLDIEAETGLLLASRPTFGGTQMATILCRHHRPQIATVRPRVMKMPTSDPSRRGQLIAERLQWSGQNGIPTEVVEVIRQSTGDAVHIEDAKVIVAGGRGLSGAKGLTAIEDLADALGGVIAGSRAAVEQGWLPHEQQVGQTGRTVRPKLYVACGISGAIQHLVGMQNSEVVVAINRDPEAPMFRAANYGIVGDLFEVVPALAQRVRRARQERERRLTGEASAAGAEHLLDGRQLGGD